MTLKQARNTIQETIPEAAEVLMEHTQRVQQAIDLIGQIMSASYDMNGECTRHFHEFEKFLKNDYLEFAREDTYPREAEAYAILQRIRANMNQMRLSPRLASRNICTIAGSFSSGKSSFLNALINGDKDILPTDLTPTTSIPTYVTHIDGNEEINVFNYEGGKKPIDTLIFKLMTDEFERHYKIKLNMIVERVVINTPHLERCKRVAFIDTPGYTHDEEDKQIALQEVLANPFLIWVVDCERGTLPHEDVDFLRKFIDQRQLSKLSSYRKSKPPMFLVLNKADKWLTEERKILSAVENVADKNRLPYFGIGLYSSHDNKWYGYSGGRFDEFLGMMNQARTMIKLDKEVEDLFDEYVLFHERERKGMKSIEGLLSRIDLKIGEESANRRLHSAVVQHRQDATEKMIEHKGHAAQSRSLKLKFTKCTQSFLHEIKAMQNA